MAVLHGQVKGLHCGTSPNMQQQKENVYTFKNKCPLWKKPLCFRGVIVEQISVEIYPSGRRYIVVFEGETRGERR